MPLPIENQLYTYADYCTWDDSNRWELVHGIPYAMAPAPGFAHQNISTKFLEQLLPFLRGKPCNAFHAPFDVRLNADDEDDIVVQPDIVVVCNKSKLDEKGCKGAPDFIIEILSPSTARHDRITKLNLYQSAGVREYWIVDPQDKTVLANVLEGGRYFITAYEAIEIAPVSVLPGCEIDLRDIFGEQE